MWNPAAARGPLGRDLHHRQGASLMCSAETERYDVHLHSASVTKVPQDTAAFNRY